MDYQYYKNLFISIAGIYIVYLNFGLVQEKMYCAQCLFYIAIVTKVLMEVVLNTHPACYSFSAQLTLLLLRLVLIVVIFIVYRRILFWRKKKAI